MRKVLMAGLVAIALAPAAASAGAQKLDGADIRNVVSGKVVYIKAPFGLEVPMAFRANGTMRGDARGAIAQLGLGAHKEKDTGRWWISRNRLCQKWRNWENGRSFCFTLRKRGGVVYWRRNDGQSGTARIGS